MIAVCPGGERGIAPQNCTIVSQCKSASAPLAPCKSFLWRLVFSMLFGPSDAPPPPKRRGGYSRIPVLHGTWGGVCGRSNTGAAPLPMHARRPRSPWRPWCPMKDVERGDSPPGPDPQRGLHRLKGQPPAGHPSPLRSRQPCPPPPHPESWMSEWLSTYINMSSVVGSSPAAFSPQTGARGIRAVPTCAILGRWGIHFPHSTLTTRPGIVHRCLSRNTARTAKIRAGSPMAGARCTQTADTRQGRRGVSRGPGSQSCAYARSGERPRVPSLFLPPPAGPLNSLCGGGCGALRALFKPPPPSGGGLQGPAPFFPCFSCIFHDKTAGTVTVCPCHCPCPCVTPKRGGGGGSSYGCQPF